MDKLRPHTLTFIKASDGWSTSISYASGLMTHGIWHFPAAVWLLRHLKATDGEVVGVMASFAVVLAAFSSNYRIMSASPHWLPRGTRRASRSLGNFAVVLMVTALVLSWQLQRQEASEKDASVASSQQMLWAVMTKFAVLWRRFVLGM